MADNEPVIAPDQLKPNYDKAFKIAGVIVALALVAMVFGNHHGHIENIWLIVLAAVIVAAIAADTVLRRRGLRRGPGTL